MTPSRTTFFQGLGFGVSAIQLILKNDHVRQWFFKSFLKAFAATVVLFVILWIAGSALLLQSLSAFSGLAAGLAALFWTLLLLYFSGTISTLFISSLIGPFTNEETLLRALNLPIPLLSLKQSWLSQNRFRELLASLVSITVSLCVFPFLLFPFLIPLAVIILAAALGRESQAFGKRLLLIQNQSAPGSQWFLLGTGIIPSLFAVVPILSWTALPLMQLTGVMSFQPSSSANKTP